MSDALARGALSMWGGGRLLRLAAQRENTVYEARLASGHHVALRLHRAGYRSADAISAELRWAEALAAQGIACPAPVRTVDGTFVAVAGDGRLASLVAWVEGRPFAPTAARTEVLGAQIGRFHNASDGHDSDSALGTGAFPRWDTPALLGDTPAWGRFWENPTLTAGEAAFLSEVRLRLLDLLTPQKSRDFGLIHADLLPDNVLDTGTRLTLIDFDDCGLGYRAYDLATVLVSHVDRPEFPALRDALLAGYASVRGVAPDLAEEVALFTLIRALASCGWAASRAGPSDPRCRAYAERALRLARRWCSA